MARSRGLGDVYKRQGKNQIEVIINDLPNGSYHFLLKVGTSLANEGFVKVD
jgi:hypothetical protein